MNDDNINDYIPSILNPRAVRKQHNLSLTQNSFVSRCSLSLKRINGLTPAKSLLKHSVNPLNKVPIHHKENLPNTINLIEDPKKNNKVQTHKNDVADKDSLGFSCVEDLLTTFELSPSFDYDFNKPDKEAATINLPVLERDEIIEQKCNRSCKSISTATELEIVDTESISTIIYNVDKPEDKLQSTVQVSFGVNGCENVDVNAKNGNIKGFSISHNDMCTNVDCEVLFEISQVSTEAEVNENMTETSLNSRKRPAVAISLEIKKQKLTQTDSSENSKVLILNTNAIEKISHVIVQPPNYKFVKRNIPLESKISTEKSCVRNGNTNRGRLKQVAIERYFCKSSDALLDVNKQLGCSKDAAEEMSKNSGVIDTPKCDRSRPSRANKKDLDASSQPKPSKDVTSPRIKCSNSEGPSPKAKTEGMSAHTPGKNVESTSLHFSLPAKSKSNKTSLSPRNIPHHKIVAGTHFAVDAFSYGEIPNVKHYFLTHFHSDHYSGLKKNFNKLLYCSKITADLCITRLGVNPKNIRMMNADEVHRIEGIEVASVDANHCPGALMLVFTLPNGKTLLHTGDFRACPSMESYPLFWNKDIHTIYLDTTYCNPRYDFPTQDQSLEMALYILRQKKMTLEKAGKKFSSVLIVCGTYTIGKEKFFLGMSRRVGCSVWACPEKERVLQIVEGRACSHEPPQACQMHVVPMRDLTHEKLRSYLDSLQGAFNEVVAFKPSGWENGKNSSVEKDSVTIHGIPYSEHSSFSELIRFVKFLKPKQVVPTVDISGGVKAVQKYFPCPLVYKDEIQCQSKVTDYFSIHNRQQVATVT